MIEQRCECPIRRRILLSHDIVAAVVLERGKANCLLVHRRDDHGHVNAPVVREGDYREGETQDPEDHEGDAHDLPRRGVG